jgi:ligand-binding sensor domain-containing protein
MNGLEKNRRRSWGLALLAMVLSVSDPLTPALLAQAPNSKAGQPVVGKCADGQLELFEIDAEGILRQRWQQKPNGDWSSWSSLGGNFLPGLATANAADGSLMLFAVDRTNGALKCIRQCDTNILLWSDWLDLGGDLLPPLAVAQNADGRLEVFAVGVTNHRPTHIWQTGSNGVWSSWSDLGGTVQPGLAALKNTDGRLELFGLEHGGHALLHCWQQEANNSEAWSEWASLGGGVMPGFAVARNSIGRMEIFAVNCTNSAVVRTCQITSGESERWTPWQDFVGNQPATPPSAPPDQINQRRDLGHHLTPGLVVGQSGDDRLEVFGVDLRSGILMHRWETLVNGTDVWSPWADLGLAARPNPAVAMNEDGDLEVFAVDATNQDLIYHRRQISSASDWLDWSRLDHRTLLYHSRTWQSDEGLPDNLVRAITQTADGFLWVGTRTGLARFDGSEFCNYDAHNTPALKSSSITALCADRDGALWIGTDGGGLLRLKGGTFSEFSKSNGLAGDAVRVIYQRWDGSVWVGTTTGMSCWQAGRFHSYYQRDGLLSPVVRSLYEDRAQDLWIATDQGLNRLRRDGAMDAFAMPDGLPNDSVRALCQDRGGRLWIGSNNGLLWYNWFWANNFYAYNSKYGLSDTFVSAICEDRDGNLWVGTYSGLNRFREGRFYSQPDSDGQPFDKVNVLFVDRDGDLWVGSNEGLSHLTPQPFATYTKQQGLTHNNVTSVLQDQAGSVWIGTWGGGVNRLVNEQVTAFASSSGLPQDLILSLCTARDGNVWAGADFDGGLLCLKEGRIRRYTWQNGLINAGVHVLHEDQAGNLWIGTDRGMSCFANGLFVTNLVTEHLAGVGVRDICEEPSGALWFATQKGLDCWNKGRLTTFTTAEGLSDNSVTALLRDGENGLWIGTSGGGLVRLRQGVFTTYKRRQGLFSDEIFGIVADDQGWLWMTCSKGIFRVWKRELDAFDHGAVETIDSLVYGKNDGMKSPQSSRNGKPSAWKANDGRLWFATSKGLVTVDPQAVHLDTKPPTVLIESVVADGRIVEDERTNLAAASIAQANRLAALRIPPGHGELEFQYAALGLSEPEKERFRYRLEGVDTGWIEAGTRRIAYYNHLAPASYRFQVRACNKDGIWSPTAVSLQLVLQPHYWQTVWFHALVALAIVGSICGLALYGTHRRVQGKLALLQRQQAVEKERGRIAKDMHDQIGSGLTQIGLLGEFIRRDTKRNGEARLNVERICGLARELAQTVDEIVWTVNPRNDTLTKLGAYLAAYGEDFFQGTPIRCRLDIPPGLPAYPLSAELRHNLFLTVKEALNNIVKHSRATEAFLQLAIGPDRLELVIQDDGMGFPVAAAPSARNGLSNMRERIAEAGGELEIASQPQGGTCIRLWVPLPPPVVP